MSKFTFAIFEIIVTAGYTRHTCACGAEKRTNETPAAGHQFNVEEIVAATCTEKGYTRGTCRVCGATEKYDYQSALGHHFDYTQPGEVVEPTCTEDGYTLRTCTVCGQDVKTEIVVMLGHNYRTNRLTGKTICTRCGDEQPGGGDIRPTTPGEVMDPEEPEDPIAPNADEGDAEDATTAPEDERVLVSEVTAVYSYLYASGKLLQEKVTTDGKTETHNFFYDNSGTPYAMQVDGTTYYYITNLQGDVVEMVDASGNTVASYTYSPYGKVLTAEGTLADKNPLRYRGYYYDTESGLYYLQSRYYDPGTGRFINADSYASTGQGVLGHNMFAYCNNNPINGEDPTGMRAVCLSIGGDITAFFFGASISIGVAFDDKHNIALQWSYSIPSYLNEQKTANFGLLDAGVCASVQVTNDDTVFDLEGPGCYAGLSAGTGWFGAIDMVYSGLTVNDSRAAEMYPNGFQLGLGYGIGVDAHYRQTQTQTLWVIRW